MGWLKWWWQRVAGALPPSPPSQGPTQPPARSGAFSSAFSRDFDAPLLTSMTTGFLPFSLLSRAPCPSLGLFLLQDCDCETSPDASSHDYDFDCDF